MMISDCLFSNKFLENLYKIITFAALNALAKKDGDQRFSII